MKPSYVNPHPNDRIRQLADDITSLAAHIDAAMFRWLSLLAEFDETGGWAGDGIRSLAHWLNWQCGMSLGTARERVRVARALKDLPRTSEQFRLGRLSYSKVRAITREATPENEDILLHIARHGTAWHIEKIIRLWRREQRLEAVKDENRRHALRELYFRTDDDGSLILQARFTPEQGAVVRQALEALLETQQRERRDVPEEAKQAAAPDPLQSCAAPIASRRADALARLAEEWLRGEGSASPSANAQAARTGGDRFVVNLHTDLDTLRRGGTGTEAELGAEGIDAVKISAETSRRLACDAGVVHWLDAKPHNANPEHPPVVSGQIANLPIDGGVRWKPLSVGRKTRTVPPAIRRALQRRDGRCRFPGCTATRFVDAHHIHHWADGGSTHIDNLVLLCRHHHRLVHEGGFGLQRTAAGDFHFTTPAGARIPQAPTKNSRGNVFALMAANAATGLEITPATPRPNWDGGGMDEDIVLHALSLRRPEANG
ncbi:HNH endonuclease signature motif containing protein [Elongatibacter sediminis]|uniref:DUF222 domain-containing protein n=1 Tax=Elongatibacter sediminis TaxID=3119006 RepID=A0AAW9RNQ7_9GAMM